ncbi:MULTISPECIES: MATE family efflux transporter [unclassified Leucobacter]|uniref:MATE family efflux transporter n=1 Tax=unclassified Leucobacter TaxID=2621730 RepID=UPI00165DEA50|nr:MATE family efflux transporter [Leucobacter sp. cx-87]
MTADRRSAHRGIDRRIAALAIPALGALIAEPLFLVVDTALVGHLGADSLAGLAVASAVLSTLVGLMIFLAYATTPQVARRRGAGDLAGAMRAGVSGLWFALGLGAVLALVLAFAARPLVGAFGGGESVADQALAYLLPSAAGVPAMLLVFAAAGLLRGLQDTVTPLAVAGIGFALNAALNVLFIYGFGWGIAGSAWGTVIAQWGMVIAYLVVIARHARAAGVGPRPHAADLRQVGQSGGWLFIRTLGLRAALLATVGAATVHGAVTTAGYQVVFTLFTLAAFALDALAIAAQALVGDALGARDARAARQVLARTVWWGAASGVAFGALLAALSPWLGRIFTDDPDVLALLPPVLLVLALSLPLSGIVFVLDGVLMGAGDARYLAWTSLVNLACYLPVLWLLTRLAPTGLPALIALTAGFTLVFMLARAVTLGLRARGERWVVLG